MTSFDVKLWWVEV